MNFSHSPRFKTDLKKVPKEIRRKFYKQAEFLKKNLNHRSLHSKKYSEKDDIWQARIDKGWRFYFLIGDDTYMLLAIKRHKD